MRQLLLASVGFLSLASAAVAQTATTGPMSSTATNTTPTNTKNVISPRLPSPGVGENATPDEFLARAKAALEKRHTGEAQQALEQAETRLLDRSTVPADAAMPDPSPRVAHIQAARKALAPLNKSAADTEIMAAMSGGSDSQTYGTAASPATP